MLLKYLLKVLSVVWFCKIHGTYSIGQVYTSDLQDQYYVEFDEKFNWFESQTGCLKMNMTLVEIETSSKSDDIIALVKRVRKENNFKNVTLWIGGIMSRYPSSHFVWLSSGKQFTFTNWYANNPNFVGRNEFCVQIVMGKNFGWNDNRCLNKFGYICQLNQTLQLQEKQRQLQAELETIKATLQQEKQTHMQVQQHLQQQIEMKKDQLKQEIDKSENLDENLQAEIIKRENLQQELRRHHDMREQLQEQLQPYKVRQKEYEMDSETGMQERRSLQHKIKEQQALNLQMQKKLQQLRENLLKMPQKYDEYIKKEKEEQRRLEQKLKTPQQLQQQFREQLNQFKEKL